jgi:hypothetical protein
MRSAKPAQRTIANALCEVPQESSLLPEPGGH